MPEPKVLITDGGAGLLNTVSQLWTDFMEQRCPLHLQRTVKQYLSSGQKTADRKALRQLSLNLKKIRTAEEAPHLDRAAQ